MERNVNSPLWHWAVNVIAASPAVGNERRGRILRRAGIDVGRATVTHGVWFFGANVELGDWAYINHGCYFDNRDRITIGTRVGLAYHVMLLTSSHLPGDREQRRGPYTSAPIHIGDGCWLGARTTVLPGVTIGAGCVVAAGAVVAHDCEPHGLYGGIPARRIKDLP